jgi:HlyD family secretion protein
MRATVVLLAVVGVVVGGAAYYKNFWSGEPANSFRTAEVTQGDLSSTITATGTLEPEEIVDVGAQVTGKIENFGQDPHDPTKQVDYTTAVEDGTVLAKIDPRVYKAQYDQALAAVARAKADLLQLHAKCIQTEKEWKRAESLRPMKAIADTDYDLAKANFLVAKANVEVGKAAIQQADAALVMAKTNLDYTVIRSPVKGVVIRRRVNIGQTVVAAMSAAQLFLIAKDLHRIQVWASVNEADIGRISVGMPARFTVETYTDRTFTAKVTQIRLAALSTQNIVTYTVVLETENPDLKLFPYMTANLRFEVDKQTNVLQVPNAALRWKPRTEQIASDARAAASLVADGDRDATRKADKEAVGPKDVRRTKEPRDAQEAGAAGSGRKSHGDKDPAQKKSSTSGRKSEKGKTKQGRVWVEDGGYARPIDVQVGLSDGTMTEIAGPDVKVGMKVIVGEATKGDRAADDVKNPMMPRFPGKRR